MDMSRRSEVAKQISVPGTDLLMGYTPYKKKSPFLLRDRPGRHGLHEIVQGDAVASINSLNRPVDCWITSPPYYRQVDYGIDSQFGLEETVVDYLTNQMAVAHAMLRHSAEYTNLFYVIRDSYNQTGGSGGDYIDNGEYRMKVEGAREENWPRKAFLGIPWRLVEAFQEVGWVPISSIIWDKKDARRGAEDRMSYSYEQILLFGATPSHYWDRGAVLEKYAPSSLKQLDRPYDGIGEIDYEARSQENPSDVKRRIRKSMKKRPGRYLFDVWRIHPTRQPRVTLTSGEEHKGIASFPLLLAELCVLLGCPPGGLVGDPFCGFGTALRAAVKWGRNAWGNDLDPRSVEATRILLAQDEQKQRGK